MKRRREDKKRGPAWEENEKDATRETDAIVQKTPSDQEDAERREAEGGREEQKQERGRRLYISANGAGFLLVLERSPKRDGDPCCMAPKGPGH